MKIKISPLFFVFWILFIFLGDTEFILHIFVAAAVHESAHICAFSFFGAELHSIELLPFGISATLKNEVSLPCGKEIICAAAGPAANIALALFLSVLKIGGRLYGAELLIFCSVSLFAVNMIPVFPLDGGRILWFAALKRCGYGSAKKLCGIVGGVCAAATFAAGVYLAVVFRNISLLIIGVYLLLNIFFENKS